MSNVQEQRKPIITGPFPHKYQTAVSAKLFASAFRPVFKNKSAYNATVMSVRDILKTVESVEPDLDDAASTDPTRIWGVRSKDNYISDSVTKSRTWHPSLRPKAGTPVIIKIDKKAEKNSAVELTLIVNTTEIVCRISSVFRGQPGVGPR